MSRPVSPDTHKVYSYLTHHPNRSHSTTDIAETLGLESKKVANVLRRMVQRESVVERTGRGKYRYVPPEVDERDEPNNGNPKPQAQPAFGLNDALRVVGVLLNHQTKQVEYVVEDPSGTTHLMQKVVSA